MRLTATQLRRIIKEEAVFAQIEAKLGGVVKALSDLQLEIATIGEEHGLDLSAADEGIAGVITKLQTAVDSVQG